MEYKLIRTSTVPMSLQTFLKGSVEVLKERYDLVLLSSPDKELEELHQEYGVRVIGVPMERRIALWKDFKAFIELIRVFHREKPYMVHSMTPKAGMLCMVAAWVTRVPRRIHTFTGLVWPTATGLSRRILMMTDWLTCACATHVIPEGEGVKSDLQRCITSKPMRVLGYGNVRGVDMEYWKRTPEVMEESEEIRQSLLNGRPLKGHEQLFTFLFVGRMVGAKGINELVEAFLRLREHYLHLDNGQKVRLLLVGRREDELDPLKQVTWDRIRNTPSICTTGPVKGRRLLAYYAASDCFIFPSYREGFPNTVLEAGAMGLPSIVTDINGSREIIEQGVNGLIVPSKDVDGLFEAMLRMVDDGEMCSRMAKVARSRIEARYEQSFVRQCLLDFYQEVVG